MIYTDASPYIDGKWEIFYADGEHIYLMTKGKLPAGSLNITEYGGTSDFVAENGLEKYPAVAQGLFDKIYDPNKILALQYKGVNDDGASYNNMKATQYLLDSTVWSTYANNFADWVIGGPTFELFMKSYKVYYPNIQVELRTPSGTGYRTPLIESQSVPEGTALNHSTSYWLAGPAWETGDTVLYMDVRMRNILTINFKLLFKIFISFCCV